MTQSSSLGSERDQDRPTTVVPPSHTQRSERRGNPSDPAIGEASGGADELTSARLDAALAASIRNEASLNSLMRAVHALSGAVGTAREANVELLGELEVVRALLVGANERKAALESRVKTLEGALVRAQESAAAERVFLIDQHDNFIAALIDEHEHAQSRLAIELDHARRQAASASGQAFEPSPSNASEAELREQLQAAQRGIDKLLSERDRSRDALVRLQAQRDDAQATVIRLTRERDQARAELEHVLHVVASPSTTSHPASSQSSSGRSHVNPLLALNKTSSSSSGSGSDRPASGSGRTISSSASSSHPPPAVPVAKVTAPRPQAPPLEFRSDPSSSPVAAERIERVAGELVFGAEITTPAGSSPFASERPSSAALKSKPDPSTRPLVGYSVTEGSEEHVDTARISSSRHPKR